MAGRCHFYFATAVLYIRYSMEDDDTNLLITPLFFKELLRFVVQ